MIKSFNDLIKQRRDSEEKIDKHIAEVGNILRSSNCGFRIKTNEITTKDILLHLLDLEDSVKEEEKRNKELRKQLSEPTDEKLAHAYAKIKELEEALSKTKANSLYIKTEEDRKKIRHHFDKCGRSKVGGYYSIAPTGIGTVVTWTCNKCKEEIVLCDL